MKKIITTLCIIMSLSVFAGNSCDDEHQLTAKYKKLYKLEKKDVESASQMNDILNREIQLYKELLNKYEEKNSALEDVIKILRRELSERAELSDLAILNLLRQG